MSKHHALPFSASLTRAAALFALIHTDLWGPSPITACTGARYFMLLGDDFSRYSWIYFLSDKASALHAFCQFQQWVHTQYGTTIKAVRSDWGGEFRTLHTHLLRHGITHQISCPHIPQQNGRVERKNRHVVEVGLTLLYHSNVPLRFWP